MRKPFEPKEKKNYRLKRTPIRKISKKKQQELNKYGKLKKKLNFKVCSKCGTHFTDYKELDLHHIERRGIGGKDTRENLKPLCRSCHQKEHGILGLRSNNSELKIVK